MTHSYADRPKIPCPECGRLFSPEIWLIIDAAARTDLLARVIDGTIHDVVCPSGHAASVDTPLLLYRPYDSPTLLFSPARGTTAEQDRDNAGGLIGRLHAGLGSAQRDEPQAEGQHQQRARRERGLVAVAAAFYALAYKVGVTNLPNGVGARQFVRDQLDRLGLGDEVTHIPWGSKRFRLPPARVRGVHTVE